MAATIFGFSANEMKPQPGLQISRSESGGFSATHEIIIKAEDFANLAPNFVRGTPLVDIDPTIPPPFDEFLTVDTISFTRTDGDLYVFNITATGAPAQFEANELTPGVEPTYTLTGQLQDVPFSMHPKWKALGDGDKKLLGMLLSELLTYDIAANILYLNNDANAEVAFIDQLTAADAISFASLIQQGQATYQKSSYTWNEATEGADQLTSQQINTLGKISTPRGNPPEATAGRDWMLTNVSQSQSGELYRTTLEWTLSEEGGWDDFLYD
jgi:hypothetical protein